MNSRPGSPKSIAQMAKEASGDAATNGASEPASSIVQNLEAKVNGS